MMNEESLKNMNLFSVIGGAILFWPLKIDRFQLETAIALTIVCSPFTSFGWLPLFIIGGILDDRKKSVR